MNEQQALEKAREYLRTWLDVRLCSAPPPGLYAFDPRKEYLFEIVHGAELSVIGATTYVAVSKTTGIARFAGASGE